LREKKVSAPGGLGKRATSGTFEVLGETRGALVFAQAVIANEKEEEKLKVRKRTRSETPSRTQSWETCTIVYLKLHRDLEGEV